MKSRRSLWAIGCQYYDGRRMANRTSFVTGASRGIGRACALALASSGSRVVLAARNREKLESVASEIQAQGGEAFVVEIDLGSADSIKGAFAEAVTAAGRIDILVNNAGVTKGWARGPNEARRLGYGN